MHDPVLFRQKWFYCLAQGDPMVTDFGEVCILVSFLSGGQVTLVEWLWCGQRGEMCCLNNYLSAG